VDSIEPVGDGGCDTDGCEEVAGGFVVSRGEGAEVLQSTEGALDDVSQFVAFDVEGEIRLPVDFVGNDWRRATAFKEVAQMGCVVTLVADHRLAWRYGGKERRAAFDVGDMATRQEERVRAAVLVDERVDFRRAPAARAADRLLLLPPLAPLAERCALTAELSIITSEGASARPTRTAKILCHKPRWLQRL